MSLLKPMMPIMVRLPSSSSSSSSFGDERVGMAIADNAQAGCFLAERDALVLGAADADADDHRRAGQAAMAEGDERVDEEALEAGDAVAGEEHAVVAAEEAALVDGGEVDPVALGLEAVVDVRGHHADVVARVAAGQRMDAIRAERDVFGCLGGRRRGCAFSRATNPPSSCTSLPALT